MKLVVRCCWLVCLPLLFVVLCSSSVVAQKSTSRSITIKRVSLVDKTGKPVRGFKKLKRNQELSWESLPSADYFFRAYTKPRKKVSISYKLKTKKSHSEPTVEDQDFPVPSEAGSYKLQISVSSITRARGGSSATFKFKVKGRKPKSTSPSPSPEPSPNASPAESPSSSPSTSPEASPSESQSPVPSNSPTPEPTVVARFNAGGGNYIDTNGNQWNSDASLTKVGSHSSYSANVTVTGTDDTELYKSERWGNFQYSIPVAPGSYRVNIYLAEIFFSKAGERVFSVFAENNTVRSGLDIVAEVGSYKALVLSSDVTVSDGFLNLNFVPSVNNAKISAFEILALQGPTPDQARALLQVPAQAQAHLGAPVQYRAQVPHLRQVHNPLRHHRNLQHRRRVLAQVLSLQFGQMMVGKKFHEMNSG